MVSTSVCYLKSDHTLVYCGPSGLLLLALNTSVVSASFYYLKSDHTVVYCGPPGLSLLALNTTRMFPFHPA